MDLLPPPLRRWLWWSLGFVGVKGHHPSLPSSGHGVVLLCLLYVSNFTICEDSSPAGFGVHPGELILTKCICQEPLSRKVAWRGSVCRNYTGSGPARSRSLFLPVSGVSALSHVLHLTDLFLPCGRSGGCAGNPELSELWSGWEKR